MIFIKIVAYIKNYFSNKCAMNNYKKALSILSTEPHMGVIQQKEYEKVAKEVRKKLARF